MNAGEGWKKWGAITACACMLVFFASPLLLFAEEPAQPDQNAAVPVQKAEEPALTDQKTPAPEQKAEGPLPSTQPAPVPEQKAEGPEQSIQNTTVLEQPEKNDRTGEGMITKDETLTLSRCIEIALKKNPTIVAAVNTVDVNRNRVGEARSAYYPQISATGAYSRSKSVTTPQVNPLATTAPVNESSGTVTLNQSIYDFGRTSSSVDVSKYNLESSRSDLSNTEDVTILSVKQAYYGVLQTRRNRDVAADVIKQFQLHLDQARGFYEVGTKAKIDVIKAEVDLSNAKLSLINAENAFKIALVTLNNAMGIPDAPEYSIEDNLSFQQYPITLEEATAKAFENRPDLKSIVALRQGAEANISLQRSGYYPFLSGNANYTKSESTNVDVEPKTPSNTNSWDVGVAITFPLFNGFLTSHQVAEAKSSFYVLKAKEEATRLQILLEIRQSYLNLQAAEASISTSDLAVKQAKENLDLANGRYSAGVGSPIEVSDAFATYVTAQANYTSALANYKIAQASIEKAMGAR
jgi:outer membrane protein